MFGFIVCLTVIFIFFLIVGFLEKFGERMFKMYHKRTNKQGGITIPKQLRVKYGLTGACAVDIEEVNGGLLIKKHTDTCICCGNFEDVKKMNDICLCKKCAGGFLHAN